MSETKLTRQQFNAKWALFKAGIAMDLAQALQRRCPVDTGRLRQSINWKVDGKDIVISMAGYAVYVEFGTPPHIITPKQAQALRFIVEGTGPRGGKTDQAIFAKVVHHPGTTPNPFIRTTLRSDFKRIIMDNCKRHFAQT